MFEREIPLLFLETYEGNLNLFYTVSPVYRFFVSSRGKMLSAIQLAPLKEGSFCCGQKYIKKTQLSCYLSCP